MVGPGGPGPATGGGNNPPEEIGRKGGKRGKGGQPRFDEEAVIKGRTVVPEADEKSEPRTAGLGE